MNFLEKDLEDIIWECCNSKDGYDLLEDRNLYFHPRSYRQFKLGGYGIVDIMNVTYDSHLDMISIQLVELKKESLKVSHLIQICRYVSGLRSMIDGVDTKKLLYNTRVYGVLIVPKVDTNSDLIFLSNLLEDIRIYSYKFSLEKGLLFEPVGKDWFLKDASIYDTEFTKWDSSNFVPTFDDGSLLEELNDKIKTKFNGKETH